MGAITSDDGLMDARNLPDLMVFLEVVRSGSITRAAHRLNMVQSNVTARIKKLEHSAATPLLKRHARGVRPTPAGEAAIAIAHRLDAVLDDLRFTFGKPAGARAAKLRIGAIETVLAGHLPAVVAGFLREFPHVDVSVRTGSSAALLKQLKEGDLDAVFVSRPSGLTGARERVAFIDELVVVAPMAKGAAMKPWRTDGPPLKVLVQRLGCSYTERLLGVLAEQSRRPYRLLELGTLEGILGFVETGLGIAAMPRAFVRAAASKRKLQLFELPKAARDLRTYLVIPGGTESSFATEAFFNWTKAN
jgi:DNA-binding transcriptional LysR family regulator